jgi:hypothetical protein
VWLTEKRDSLDSANVKFGSGNEVIEATVIGESKTVQWGGGEVVAETTLKGTDKAICYTMKVDNNDLGRVVSIK